MAHMANPMKSRKKSRQPVAARVAPPKVKKSQAVASPIQTKKLDIGELSNHLGYFLRRLQVAVFKDFIRRLAPLKLRPAQYSVLLVIKANPGRAQAAIGETLNIERARLVRLLHELERRRWISRRESAVDARSHSLYLTNEGENALARIKTLTSLHEAEMAKFVGSERRMLLMDLLKDFG